MSLLDKATGNLLGEQIGKVRWTGHPFVDAGLSAIAAIARIDRLEDLTPHHLQSAVMELERLLLSDQALGLGVDRAFAKTALSQIFPNSELVNPSNWRGETPEAKVENVRSKFKEALRQELQMAQQGLCENGNEVCYVCGERRPAEAMVFMRKSKMPLLEGIVNFYPAFAHGVQVCGLCALAVRFLPLSVMRTGVYNRLWFLHTQDLPVATAVVERYGVQHFERAIAQNKAIDFFSRWQTAGDAGTVLYLLCELLEQMGDQLRAAYESALPMTAYLFSNDNRGGYVQARLIPNYLLVLIAKLQLQSPRAFHRFYQELLQIPSNITDNDRKARSRFVASIAQRLLRGDPVTDSCLDHDISKLLGGWLGHRLYLQEGRGMSTAKLAILERLGKEIAQNDSAKKYIEELRRVKGGELYGVLLRYVRDGWLKHDQFYTLLPPNDHTTATEVRDILLAVIYEWQYCQQQNEEFPSALPMPTLTPDQTLLRLQQIGERLIQRLPNLQRWIGGLQTARSSDRIRGVYLNAVRHQAMCYDDFVFLAPLSDRPRLWLLRDYLLAFLFDRARENLPEEEEIVVGAETPSETENSNGGKGQWHTQF